MLCRHVIDICSEVLNDYWNALCGKNVQFLAVKSDGTLGNHWVLKGLLRNLSTRHVWANVKALELISHSQKEWSFCNRKTSKGEDSRQTDNPRIVRSAAVCVDPRGKERMGAPPRVQPWPRSQTAIR